MMQPRYFEREKDEFICLLCPNRCHISEGGRGACLARGVEGGEFKAHSYGVVVASNLDPIEKKPLYHFNPGSMVFSVGSYGCNLHCRFCQNSDISQNVQHGVMVSPQKMVEQAKSLPGSGGVAFTYNEPGIWFEYIMDCAPLLKKAGLPTILVTNGYLDAEPFAELCAGTDAMNIDLKSFNPKFYREICGGDLETVKQNILQAVAANVHVELTHLVITDLNDNEAEFSDMVDWVSEISDELVLHISRYFPRYRETSPPTSLQTLENFMQIARRKLKFVYPGNVAAEQSTFCPDCKKLWIKRSGYRIEVLQSEGVCDCKRAVPFAKGKCFIERE